MREIIFRGKRTDNGEWVEGNFIADAMEPLRQDYICWGFIKYYDKSVGKAVTHEVERETVSQYTGLKDKNGKKIFEGDIVANALDHSIRATIIYSHVSFCYQWDKYTSRIRRCESEPMFTNTNIVMEVIGNIHDNPELLGGN